MHILLIIHSLSGGGAERVTSQMAEYWSQRNIQVSLVTIASTKHNRYELPAGVNCRALGIEKKSSNLVSGAFNSVSRIFTVRRTIKDIGPDVVIAMMSDLSVLAGLACIKLPTRCIGSERVYPGNYPISRVWGFMRKYAYRLLDAVVVQSKMTEQWMYENTQVKRVCVIANALHLPLPRLEPVLEPEKAANEKWILGAGRLTDQKQFDHLIRSFAALANQFPQWKLMIIGEGENRSQLERLIIKCGLEKRVFLIGRVGNIVDWYNSADVFALTSGYEGFPNALIEAMAHGVPCVSYNCLTGPGEIIEDGVNGLLVDLDDENALILALHRVLSSELLRQQLSEVSVSIVDELRPDVIMAKWEQEIHYLLEH